jgi:release factor glutamine methyltransferase
VTADIVDLVIRLRTAGCVFAEDEARLITETARTPAEAAAMAERRASGLPLEHVLGWADFCGLRIQLDPGVFVPRRRTEFLVSQAAALAPDGAVVLDLCCGSGAIGAAVASRSRGGVSELHAADLDPAAVRCARRNLAPLSATVHAQVHLGDLYAPLPAALRGRVDVLLANVPYVPTDDIPLLPPEARLHEPHLSLDGGADGLSVLRRVAAGAERWLAPGGVLLTETSERQAPHAADALARVGLAPRVAESESEEATVVIGERRPSRPSPPPAP